MAKSEQGTRTPGERWFRVEWDWPVGHHRREAPGYTGADVEYELRDAARAWELARLQSGAQVLVREVAEGDRMTTEDAEGRRMTYKWMAGGWQRVIA